MCCDHAAVRGWVTNLARDEPALTRPADAAGWVQCDLALRAREPAVYTTLGATLDDLLATGAIDDGFFVHKPPGIRFRFRPVAPRADVAARVASTLDELVDTDRIAGWRPAVYEPEQRLFGGPVAMRSVHRVFTADSVAWLRVHGTPAADRPRSVVWALSLLMIGALFHALEIIGWEHVGVWDRIASDGGRRLAADAAADPRVRLLGRHVRAGWHDPAALRSGLPAGIDAPLADYERAVHAAARTWRSDYFTAPGGTVGPRQAAAYAVIFHWNRAALPALHQALITDVLAAAQDRP